MSEAGTKTETKSDAKTDAGQTDGEETTLVYGSADYTRINPAMDEHGEINVLLFSGLAAHDADDSIVPGLAEKWEYDAETCTSIGVWYSKEKIQSNHILRISIISKLSFMQKVYFLLSSFCLYTSSRQHNGSAPADSFPLHLSRHIPLQQR